MKGKYFKILFIITVFLINLIICKPRTFEDNDILAKWDGDSITLSEFRDIYLETPKSVYKNNYDFDSLHLELKRYIAIKKILKIVDSLQIDTVKIIADKYDEYVQTLCLYKVIEDSVKRKVISDKMIRNIFSKIGSEYLISQILVKYDTTHNSISADSLYSLLNSIKSNIHKQINNLLETYSNLKYIKASNWLLYNDLSDELQDMINQNTDIIYNPALSDSFHYIFILDSVKNSQTNLKFYTEKHSIFNQLDKLLESDISKSRFIFDDYLFKKYEIKIDTTAVDLIRLLYNFNNTTSNSGNNEFSKIIAKNTVITEIGNFSYNIYNLYKYLNVYQPELKNLARHNIIESAHSMLRRILVNKFVQDIELDKDQFIIKRARILLFEDYLKYYIYQYLIPEIVSDFETNKIKSFPSYDELKEDLLDRFQVDDSIQINYNILFSIN